MAAALFGLPQQLAGKNLSDLYSQVKQQQQNNLNTNGISRDKNDRGDQELFDPTNGWTSLNGIPQQVNTRSDGSLVFADPAQRPGYNVIASNDGKGGMRFSEEQAKQGNDWLDNAVLGGLGAIGGAAIGQIAGGLGAAADAGLQVPSEFTDLPYTEAADTPLQVPSEFTDLPYTDTPPETPDLPQDYSNEGHNYPTPESTQNSPINAPTPGMPQPLQDFLKKAAAKLLSGGGAQSSGNGAQMPGSGAYGSNNATFNAPANYTPGMLAAPPTPQPQQQAVAQALLLGNPTQQMGGVGYMPITAGVTPNLQMQQLAKALQGDA